MRLGIRVGAVAAVLLLPVAVFSQRPSDGLNDLYRFVEQVDSLSVRSQKTFYLEKFLKDNYNYRETWRFSEAKGKVVYFQVDYFLDSIEYTEVYYLDRGNLVCSEEYEKVNYSFSEDQLKFGSILYFESATPRHVVMLGRRNFNTRSSDPGDLALMRFEQRFIELKRHIPMLVN